MGFRGFFVPSRFRFRSDNVNRNTGVKKAYRASKKGGPRYGLLKSFMGGANSTNQLFQFTLPGGVFLLFFFQFRSPAVLLRTENIEIVNTNRTGGDPHYFLTL